MPMLRTLFFEHRLGDVAAHICGNETRRHGIYPNAFRREFLGGGDGHSNDGRFRSGIDRQTFLPYRPMIEDMLMMDPDCLPGPSAALLPANEATDLRYWSALCPRSGPAKSSE